jgi:hypothetical protein
MATAVVQTYVETPVRTEPLRVIGAERWGTPIWLADPADDIHASRQPQRKPSIMLTLRALAFLRT